MAWRVGEMIHDGARAYSMGCLQGSGGDFQHLSERSERFSGYLGRVIGAGVGDHDDPQGVVPSGVAVGRK
jgi:hypothetical protein